MFDYDTTGVVFSVGTRKVFDSKAGCLECWVRGPDARVRPAETKVAGTASERFLAVSDLTRPREFFIGFHRLLIRPVKFEKVLTQTGPIREARKGLDPT